MADTATYRTIWRWHFYAGLFVLPFVLILSITGAIYLFKPQIDRWEEREYRGLSVEGSVSADIQLEAALAQFPQGRFHHYRLPEHSGDAAMIQLGKPDGTLADVYVSPQGQVLGTIDPSDRISTLIATFHGSLMMGKWGDRLVELAASWTIVMILTGLYLWWPRPFRAGGTVYPRLSLEGRPLLKDMHRVTGFWIAGLVLVMLASGLPWAGSWGSAFKWARSELGLIEGPQEWKVGTDPKAPDAGSWSERASTGPTSGVSHDHSDHFAPVPRGEPLRSDTTGFESLPLSVFVARAEKEAMAFPVLILPPKAPQRFGPPTGDAWTVKSEAQNRPLIRSFTYDPASSTELSRSDFSDKHAIDRVVNYGIAWHEGQLFGVANQIIGLLTAIALIALSIIGVMMWLYRRPEARSKGPQPVLTRRRKTILTAMLVGMALLLPLFGGSLLIMLVAQMFSRGIRAMTVRRDRVGTMESP